MATSDRIDPEAQEEDCDVRQAYLREVRISFNHPTSPGSLVDVDLIIATEEVLAMLPEASDSRWGRPIRAAADVLGLAILARLTV